MNKEEFIKKIKEINATVPNEYFFLEYNKCVCDILEENQELKKRLEASRRVSKHHLNRELDLENQQKEFIEYLNWQIKNCMDTYKKYGPDNININYAAAFEVALDKYKEIIGAKDE